MWLSQGGGLRSIAKRPAYASAVIASIALGVGLNAAAVAVAANVLERPLPFERPSELVQFGQATSGTARGGRTRWEFLNQDIQAWRISLGAAQAIAVVAADERVVSGDAVPEYAFGAAATTNLTNVLGIRPLLGRWFSDSEIHERVVVLSEGLWQRQFAGDASAIGRRIRLQGESWTVIGVLPRAVGFPLRSQYWLPSRGDFGQVIARLPRGTDRRSLESRLSLTSPSVANLARAGHRTSIVAVNLRDRLFGDAKPALHLLIAASLLLLLVACANMSNLCINRNLERRQEFAVRLALGASRRDIVRAVVAENVLLSTVGAGVGAVIAFWFARLMLDVAPPDLTRLDTHGISAVDVAMVGLLAILVVSLVSVIVGAGLSENALRPLLGGGGIRGGKGQSSRLREALVVVQLALALMLLTGLGLVTRTIVALTRPEHVGFDPANVVVATLRLRGERYAGDEQKAVFLSRLTGRIRALPNVEEVGLGPAPLVAGADELVREGFSTMFVYDDSMKRSGASATVWIKHVDARYVQTYRMQIQSGRGFAISDDAPAQPVAILNRSAAELFFPDGAAVGGRLEAGALKRPDGRSITVVGVVGDALQRGLATESNPEILLPLAQQTTLGPIQTIGVRVSRDPLGTIAAVRTALRDIDPDLAAARLEPMSDVVNRSLAMHRFLGVLLSGFGILAISLASIGLYGVMSYMVQRRSAEFGVRMALGARRRHVLAIVWQQTATLVAAGIVLGAIGAVATGGLMSRLVYGVSNYDAVTFGIAPCVMASCTLIAALVPAIRAAAVDPCQAIRSGLE